MLHNLAELYLSVSEFKKDSAYPSTRILTAFTKQDIRVDEDYLMKRWKKINNFHNQKILYK